MRKVMNITMTRENLDQVKDFLLGSKTHVILNQENGEIFLHGFKWGKSIKKAMKFQFSWQAESYIIEHNLKTSAYIGVKEIEVYKNLTEKIPSTYTDEMGVVKEVKNIGGRDKCYSYDTEKKSYFKDFDHAVSWYYHSLIPNGNNDEPLLEDYDFTLTCDHVNW